jgi:hypothetical protein
MHVLKTEVNAQLSHTFMAVFDWGALWIPRGLGEPPGVENTLLGVSPWGHWSSNTHDVEVNTNTSTEISIAWLSSKQASF